MVAQGDRARLFGVNVIGLRRAGYSNEHIEVVRRAYKLLFDSTTPFKEALEQLSGAAGDPEDLLRSLCMFLSGRSKRGVCRRRPDPKVRLEDE